MPEPLRRGDEIRRPTGWVVRVVDLRAAKGWGQLVSQAPSSADRAWVAITSDPRCRDDPTRQHPLKYDLSRVKVDGVVCEQWQFEVTGGGRIWYAVDDERQTLWITHAGTGHPKQTDRRR
ncbi:hypothetical protein AB0I35_03310 [Nocardia sp. NPDC050378]|uniref:hypothetical protein n=1 Tax=Nocardia sp. NPDC050378 TaxID=3155400 RepID=UPI0033D59B47